MSCLFEDAMRAMAFGFMCVKLHVGRMIYLLALLVIHVSLELGFARYVVGKAGGTVQ